MKEPHATSTCRLKGRHVHCTSHLNNLDAFDDFLCSVFVWKYVGPQAHILPLVLWAVCRQLGGLLVSKIKAWLCTLEKLRYPESLLYAKMPPKNSRNGTRVTTTALLVYDDSWASRD